MSAGTCQAQHEPSSAAYSHMQPDAARRILLHLHPSNACHPLPHTMRTFTACGPHTLPSPCPRTPQLSGKFAPSVPGRRKKAEDAGPSSSADAASQDEKFAALIQAAQADAGRGGRGRFGGGRGTQQRTAVAFGGGTAAAPPLPARHMPATKGGREGGAGPRCGGRGAAVAGSRTIRQPQLLGVDVRGVSYCIRFCAILP